MCDEESEAYKQLEVIGKKRYMHRRDSAVGLNERSVYGASSEGYLRRLGPRNVASSGFPRHIHMRLFDSFTKFLHKRSVECTETRAYYTF